MPEQGALGAVARRGAVVSAAAMVLGQVVALAQTLVLARLLTPEEVGIAAAGAAVVTFLGPLAEGALSQALIQRTDRLDDAAETAFWATLGANVVLCGVVVAGAPLVGALFGAPAIGSVTAASAGCLVLFALTTVPDALMQRRLQLARRLVIDPLQALVFAGVSIALAAHGFGVWSLVLGSYAALATWVVGSWSFAGWRPGRGRVSLRIWREMARFGRPLIVGSVVERTRETVELVVVGRWLSAGALGQYRYGKRIASLPGGMIVAAGAFVLFPVFSRIADDRERLAAAFLRALTWLWGAAVPVAGVLVACGEPMTVVLFGEPWRGAGVVVAALACGGLGQAVLAVTTEVLKSLGRTQVLNHVTVIGTLVGFALLAALLPLGLVGVGLAVAGGLLAAGGTGLWHVLRVLPVTVAALAGRMLPPVVASGVAAAVVGTAERTLGHADGRPVGVALAVLAADVLAYALVHGAVLLVVSREARAAARQLVRL